MLRVKKGNIELKIDETMKDSYLATGYSLIDDKGNMLEKGKATGIEELREENTTLKLEVDKLNKEIEKLNKELKAANKKISDFEKEKEKTEPEK